MASTFTLSTRRGVREFRSLDLTLPATSPRELSELAARGRLLDVSGPSDYFEERFAAMISEAATEHLEIFLPPFVDLADRSAFDKYRSELVQIAAFVDEHNRLRIAHRALVIQFEATVPLRERHDILNKWGLARRSSSPFKPEQWNVEDISGRHAGAGLIELASMLNDLQEIRFAEPDFVSEYRLASPPVSTFLEEQWHLPAIGVGEAWEVTHGKPTIVIAVVDDGIDIDHPNLQSRVAQNPDPSEPQDEHGRDYTVPPTDPDHFDPRPKQFAPPWTSQGKNDIHGTPCAGIAVADGTNGVVGAAPGCRLLAVKAVRAGTDMCWDSRVADAIRYAANFSDIVSCSLVLCDTAQLASAVQDASAGRQGKGTAIVCAAGNNVYQSLVLAPAKYPETIAVGACTRAEQHASYASTGPEIDLVAPSNGDGHSIYTTDVSLVNRGFAPGSDYHGGFGGTSAATPLVAAVGALCLSVEPSLTREALRQLLRETADKIGTGYTSGHSHQFGYGRVNAAAAVEAAASAGFGSTPEEFVCPPGFFSPTLPAKPDKSRRAAKKRVPRKADKKSKPRKKKR